ncbi:MAG: hypothetical protein JW709_04400 [Sedimentisphaerales bacterium]|nr:hypothetical protein [Sedimentisphaerales bacterium]
MACGCRPHQSSIDESLLANENIFAPPEIRDELLLVSCYFQPYEVGGGVAVANLPFWDKLSLDGGAVGRHERPVPGEKWGIPSGMVQRWRENGLRVAVGSGDDWAEVVADLQEQGAKAIPGTTAFYRLAGQVVDFPLLRTGPRTVFIFRGGAAPRGSEWPAGQMFFRVGCRPLGEQVENGPCFISLVPVLVDADQPLHYPGLDIPNAPAKQELVIEDLLLEGTLPPNSFFCIAPTDTNGSISHCGKALLTAGEEPVAVQWIVLLAPQMATGKQIKEQIETSKRLSP